MKNKIKTYFLIILADDVNYLKCLFFHIFTHFIKEVIINFETKTRFFLIQFRYFVNCSSMNYKRASFKISEKCPLFSNSQEKCKEFLAGKKMNKISVFLFYSPTFRLQQESTRTFLIEKLFFSFDVSIVSLKEMYYSSIYSLTLYQATQISDIILGLSNNYPLKILNQFLFKPMLIAKWKEKIVSSFHLFTQKLILAQSLTQWTEKTINNNWK